LRRLLLAASLFEHVAYGELAPTEWVFSASGNDGGGSGVVIHGVEVRKSAWSVHDSNGEFAKEAMGKWSTSGCAIENDFRGTKQSGMSWSRSRGYRPPGTSFTAICPSVTRAVTRLHVPFVITRGLEFG
jgi:hypothetical protein